MIVFERVTSLQIIHTFCNKWIFVILFLVLFTVSANTHPLYANDVQCAASDIEGLPTECVPYLDNTTGAILPEATYFKCDDTIPCNIPRTHRCCIKPLPGSFGGECLDPKTSRAELGAGDAADGGSGIDFINIKPKTCTADEDALSESGKAVIIIPPLPTETPPPGTTPTPVPPDYEPPPRQGQSMANYINPVNKQYQLDGNPSVPSLLSGTGSEGTRPMFEDTMIFTKVVCKQWIPIPLPPFAMCFKYANENISEKFVFEERSDGSRGYFVHIGALAGQYTKKLNGIDFKYRPREPREGAKFPANFGCRLGNVFLTPIYGLIKGAYQMISSQDNMPDVSLLCTKGSPTFGDPTKIGFEEDGSLTGLDQTDCYCSDSNSGPAIAGVLLCTRYLAAMDDVGAPWRLIVPVPDTNGQGSHEFTSLLFGGIEETGSIDEFRQRIKETIDGFYDTPGHFDVWATQIWRASQTTLVPLSFIQRFFNLQVLTTTDPSPADIARLRSNRFAGQYIQCLACAKFGGFPSALGCMPMDKVDRFLAEGVLGIGIAFAGAFAVLCIIFGAIQFQLSGGESAKVQKAQKLITQCIVGLLIIIFSVFLLRFVGVNLLRIYGLG